MSSVADESTWLGLAARQETRAPGEIRRLTEILPGVLRRTPPGEPPSPLEGVEDNLARLAVLTGWEACAGPAQALRPFVDRAVDAVAERIAEADVEIFTYAVSLLNLLTVLRGTGNRAPGADDARAAEWLGRIVPEAGELDEDYQRRAACAAIGYGHTDLAHRILDGPLAEWSQVDGLREVAAAVAQRAPAQVRHAWLAYLFALPSLLAASWAAFGDLVAVGRAVHVLVGGAPEGELTERIRADLW